MVSVRLFPSVAHLKEYEKLVPDWMYPNTIPYAGIVEGYLSDAQCDEITEKLMTYEPYRVNKGCGATSRECGNDSSILPINNIAHHINRSLIGFDLDAESFSWLQSYGPDEGYKMHMDAGPGRSRKMTAITMLTDPKEYDGGQLTFHVNPLELVAPKTRGTVIIFQAWLQHDVTPLTRGFRQTINTSFWGPPFR